jgi:hypothetical protein
MLKLLKDAVVSGPLEPALPKLVTAAVLGIILCGTMVVSLILTSVLTPVADSIIARAQGQRQQPSSSISLAAR